MNNSRHFVDFKFSLRRQIDLNLTQNIALAYERVAQSAKHLSLRDFFRCANLHKNMYKGAKRRSKIKLRVSLLHNTLEVSFV